MTLPEQQEQLIDDLAVLPSPTERLTFIMERAAGSGLPENRRIEAHRIQGCVSAVWMVPEFRDGCCFFSSDAESHLVRGLVFLLCDLYSGHSPKEILETKLELIEALGLERKLSPTRLQGLMAIHATITAFAQHCLHS